MFATAMTNLTLASPAADDLFPNIRGDEYDGDVSFLATMRALLYSRVPQDESVFLRCQNDVRESDAVDHLFSRLQSERNTLFVYCMGGTDIQRTTLLGTLDAKVASELSASYTPVNDLSLWIEREAEFHTKIYTSAELRNTVIFADRLNYQRWHLLASLMTRYFPWYFTSAPLSQEELNLVRTLIKRSATDYFNAIEAFSQKFDFRSAKIRTQLAGFETMVDRQRLVTVRRKLENVAQRLNDLRLQFSSLYQQMDEYRIQELGLSQRIEQGSGDGSDEIMQYFLLNKTLQLEEVSGGRITFIVNTVMANFDPDAAEAMIDNKRSFFYVSHSDGCYLDNDDMTLERMERLLREIFLKETLKLRLCAAYTLNFGNGEYSGIQHYSFPKNIVRDHLTNPHIQEYSCLGQNDETIAASMVDRDCIGAVAACALSASSINVVESATCGELMQQLFSDGVGPVIQMPDGSTMTPLDAVLWLEEQDAKAQEHEENNE